MTKELIEELRAIVASTPELKQYTDGSNDEQLGIELSYLLPVVPKPNTFIGERGIYAVLGPEEGEKFLEGIEAASQENKMLARVLRWLQDAIGIDIGQELVQQQLKGLADLGVISQESAQALINHGSQYQYISAQDAAELREMSSVITPNWTDAVVVIAPQKITPGTGGSGPIRGTIDLRGKLGARVFIKIGRLTTTVLAAAINVYIRPVFNNGTAGGMSGNIAGAIHPTGAVFQSQIAVTVCPTVATTNRAVGDKIITLSAGTSMVEGDVICISDSGGTTFTRTEFNIITKVATNDISLVNGLEYAHTSAQADIVSRLADVFTPINLPGGSLYEVIIDYSRSATGGDVVAMAHAQTYDSNTAT